MAHFTGLVFKWIVFIFVSKCSTCAVIDSSAEVSKLLESEGIKRADSDIKKLARSFVLERHKAHQKIALERENAERERADAFRYIGELEATKIEKEAEVQKHDAVVIPLGIRQVAVIIEGECPVTYQVPSSTSIRVTTDFSQNDVSRTYQWFEILKIYRYSNLYVKSLCNALEKNFKEWNNISEIKDVWVSKYDAYKLDFCKSTVLAINHGNKLVTFTAGVGNIKTMLSLCYKPVDKFMKIFYNAMFSD